MPSVLEIVTGAIGIVLFAAALVFLVRKARSDQTFQQPDDSGSPGSGGGKPPKGSGPVRPD